MLRRDANIAPRSGAWLLVMRAKKSCVTTLSAPPPPIVNTFQEYSASLASCREPGREDGKKGRDVGGHVWDFVLLTSH